jgi:hypothetical protein
VTPVRGQDDGLLVPDHRARTQVASRRRNAALPPRWLSPGAYNPFNWKIGSFWSTCYLYAMSDSSPHTPTYAELYRQAFDAFGTKALWNRAPAKEPTRPIPGEGDGYLDM